MPVCLVVDDQPSVRTYVSTILQQEEFQTLEAEDGAHAFQIAQELDGGLDLVISDVQVPDGDGLSFAKALNRSFPAVPVILISGGQKPDGGFEFIEKPFLPATLMSAVWKLLPHRINSEQPA
jgi:DNA-binding NtrC family response regulator